MFHEFIYEFECVKVPDGDASDRNRTARPAPASGVITSREREEMNLGVKCVVQIRL